MEAMNEATREQIARDASQWWARNDGPTEDPEGLFEDAYADGATHQHHISFEAGKKEGYYFTASNHPKLKEQLEALKKV